MLEFSHNSKGINSLKHGGKMHMSQYLYTKCCCIEWMWSAGSLFLKISKWINFPFTVSRLFECILECSVSEFLMIHELIKQSVKCFFWSIESLTVLLCLYGFLPGAPHWLYKIVDRDTVKSPIGFWRARRKLKVGSTGRRHLDSAWHRLTPS